MQPVSSVPLGQSKPSRVYVMGTHLIFLTSSPIFSFLTHFVPAIQASLLSLELSRQAPTKAFVVVVLPALPSYICTVTSRSSLKVWLTVTCPNPSPNAITCPLPPGTITPHYPGWPFLLSTKIKRI